MSHPRQETIYPARTFKPTVVHNQNAQRTRDPMMLARETDHTASSPTTTDQYHHTETIWRIILDLTGLAILLAITIVSHFLITPFTRGFFCSDETIKYPIKGNTIPTYAAVILSIFLPIVWMWTTEICKRIYFTRYPKQVFLTRLELCGTKIASIPPFVRNLYMLTIIFAYGYLSTWVLTEITKNFVGELRPHFIATCQPSFDCSTVTVFSQFNSYLSYGSNYTCLNTDQAAIRDARRSFFSGHTAPIFFGFGWLIMYIHVSWSWRHLGVLGHIFQTGIAILGFYIGYTRISDFHHHWHDVLVGGIVGSLVAFVSFKFILNWRHYDPSFLPYVVRTTQTAPVLSSNEGIPTNNRNNSRRVSPKNDYERNHYNQAYYEPNIQLQKDKSAFEVAESDSDTALALEKHPEQVPLCRYRTSSNESKRQSNKMASSPSRYPPLSSQEKYHDDSSAEAKWIPPPNVAVRSRQPAVQPVSFLKLVFDGVSLLIVLLTWLLFKYFVKPVRRAFLCSDLNLYHPPPQKKVFPTWLLFVCAIIIPLIVIVLSEGVRWYYLVRKKAGRVVYKIRLRSNVINIPQWVGNLYIIIGVFLFANCANSFLTNVGKVAVGRLRPHFIPSCFAKYSYKDFCADPNDWIVNYTCLGESSTAVKDKDGAYDIRQSFPSGHASSAFCGLIFLALYIHKVWNYRNIGLFPYVVEMLCFALAAYIGITRVTDNRHHATDVLSGAILGTVVAIIAFRYMVGSFKRSVPLELSTESTTD